MKFSIFNVEKCLCILHGQVFVMPSDLYIIIFGKLSFLARLHEVHKAIVVISCTCNFTSASASHFRLKFLKLLYLDSH